MSKQGRKYQIMKLSGYGLVICLIALLLIPISLYGCVPSGGSQTELIVFTSISLKKPMTEIAKAYEVDNPGVKVKVNCAGSGSLAAQIAAGVPADVFISASVWDVNALTEKGLIDRGTQRIVTGNWLVLVAAAENSTELRGFKDLATERVKRIALGNPKLAASGAYADEVLTYYGIKDRISDKLVYYDQVAKVIDSVVRKEADAGIIFYTDYLAYKDQLSLIEEAPESSHSPVRYPAAVVTQSLHPVEAARFIESLCSEKSKAILAENGFRLSTGVKK